MNSEVLPECASAGPDADDMPLRSDERRPTVWALATEAAPGVMGDAIGDCAAETFGGGTFSPPVASYPHLLHTVAPPAGLAIQILQLGQ